MQYWEMDLPIYQIQMYQKAPPITKHTNVTQKSPNLSQHLKTSKVFTKSQQNLKEILKYYSNHCSVEK